MSLAAVTVGRGLQSRIVDFWNWLPKGARLPLSTWQARHHLLLGVIWLHIPFLAIIGWRAGIETGHLLIELVVVIAITLSVGGFQRRALKAIAVSLALVSCSALLVHFTNGLIESHFHFFVVLPLISLYRDWRPLATGLIFVILHHSVLGVALPASVYNHPAALANPVRWAFVHGIYVLLTTAVIVAYWRFSEDLEQALAREEQLRLRAEEDRHRAEAERLAHVVLSKDRFVASVSHELRTPLSAVLGFSEILRDSDHELTEEERSELVSTIAREAYDIVGIVDDLLVAARAEIDAVHVSKVAVDLSANVAQVVEVLPDHHRQRLAVGWRKQATRAIGDPVRLRQIVRNLITNALRYGGPRIWVEFDQTGDDAILRVRDNGPGIPEDERDKVFEAYHSAHSPGSQPSSVGLGLTVARQLAQLMGGTLNYDFHDGVSTFEVRLPAAQTGRAPG